VRFRPLLTRQRNYCDSKEKEYGRNLLPEKVSASIGGVCCDRSEMFVARTSFEKNDEFKWQKNGELRQHKLHMELLV
jgi:hypothetical protein